VKTCKARDIEAALLKKGFWAKDSHHRLFYLTKAGKITDVHTFMSHGLPAMYIESYAFCRNIQFESVSPTVSASE
jgi:hypothetical protein